MDPSLTRHQKHASLARPEYGEFHRHEWALLGAPCSVIKDLSRKLIDRLEGEYRIGYVDADHSAPAKEGDSFTAEWTYTDKITYQRIDRKQAVDTFSARQMTLHLDAVLVNGNHFNARRQIVIVHPDKEDSLRRKLDRLTNVQLVLLAEGVERLFPFLQDKLSTLEQVPVMRLSDVQPVHEWFASQMAKSRPPLYGLVLAGGRSTRMGEDKGRIDYHGKAQREHTADLLDPFCEQTYYSVRSDQKELPRDGRGLIHDSFDGLGAYSGLLSAFRIHPDAAWFAVATDLPLLDEIALAQLQGKRNASRFATAFLNPATRFPEPLISIWEPRSYPRLLEFLAQGYSCPRKVLINSDIELVDPANPEALTNVNKPDERKEIERKLKARN